MKPIAMKIDKFKELMKEKERATPRHLEHALQVECVRWFKRNHQALAPLLFAVNNGTKIAGNKTQCAIRGARLKAEGVTAGVADLILLVSRGGYHSLCIEMKWSNGKQSEAQRAWQAAAEETGNLYIIIKPDKCRSDEETIENGKNKFALIVTKYLNSRFWRNDERGNLEL